ncbi:Ras family protein [Entamoeba marina]
MTKPLIINVTICGGSNSGKTSLLNRMVSDTFSEDKVENLNEYIQYKTSVDGVPLQLEFIERSNDTFMKKASTDAASRGDVLYYIYNSTDKQSFEDTINVFQYFVRMNDSSVIYLVANATDSGKRAVTMTEGKAAVENSGGFYAEISCKTGDGVKELLETSIHQYFISPQPKIKERLEGYKKLMKKI